MFNYKLLLKKKNIKTKGIRIISILVLYYFFYEKMMLSPEGFQLMGSCSSRDSVFICLLLPENVIICGKMSVEMWENGQN